MTDVYFERAPDDPRALYIDLLKRILINWIYANAEPETLVSGAFDFRPLAEGRRWPQYAHTMIGLYRLNNIQHCVETVIRDGIPGDFLEAGVWRGGASIFMRGILKAYGISDRRVWVADSFAGLPPPNAAEYPADEGLNLHEFKELAVPLDEVRANFFRYGLLDEQVVFLEGWFRDTLPAAPVKTLSVLRLDGDLYESTMDTLTSMYPKVARGGFVIVDDYWWIPAARKAVDDYRSEHGIEDSIIRVDYTGVFWRRSK